MSNIDRLQIDTTRDAYGLPASFDLDSGSPVSWEWPDYGLSLDLDGVAHKATFSQEDVPEVRLDLTGEALEMTMLIGPEATCEVAVRTFDKVRDELDAYEAIPEEVASRLSTLNPYVAVVLA